MMTHSSSSSSGRQEMLVCRRQSITDNFELNRDSPVPGMSRGGARIKVCYAGACYTDSQVVNSGQRRPRMQGVMDTSLFPGFEVSGVVDELCPTLTNDCHVKVGDRVIVYPTIEEEVAETGYAEFMLVNDVSNLVKIPDDLPLDVAATIPCGALAAFAAVERVRPFIADRLEQTTNDIVNVLIVGAGGLGLWTLRVAEYFLGENQSRVRLTVADNNVDKLELAKEHGCYDVIHWCDSLHEEYIDMRTKNVCKGGIDAVIDFASSSRTVLRSLKVLKEGGVIIVGGNSKCDVPLCLYDLAIRNQSVLGVHCGTRQQLTELVRLVANGKIIPPVYSVYPIEEADYVFRQLSHCQIDGRAVLRVSSDAVDTLAGVSSSSVFLGASSDQLDANTPSDDEPMASPTIGSPVAVQGFFLST